MTSCWPVTIQTDLVDPREWARMLHMAWEWVTPVAGGAVAAVAAVAGIVATYKSGNRQQQTALAVAQQQADSQVAIAREERQQRRLEEAYLGMLAALTSIYYWAQAVYPFMTNTPEQFTMPPLPEMADNEKKEALWTAYWSPRIEQLMGEWQIAVRALQHAGLVIGMARSFEGKGRESGLNSPEWLLKLPDLKQAIFDVDKRIRNQVRLELLGQHDGHAEPIREVDAETSSAPPSS
jgi:hypothetical protein